MENLQDYLGYLFDLDGVLWVGETVIPGAQATLAELRHRGKGLLFVSNTSTQSHADCLLKFERLGLPVNAEELFVASQATARHLAALRPGATAYVIGSDGLLAELRHAGLDARPAVERCPQAADFVVVGRDTDISYDKLVCALRAVRGGARLVAVNLDATIPEGDGPGPGAGAIVAAVSAMVAREPDITIAKPGTLLLEMALAQAGLSPGVCAMVGDTLEADVAAGKQLGMDTILVLSGNAARGDVQEDLRPDWIIPSVLDLIGEPRSMNSAG